MSNSTISVNLSFQQLVKAVKKLPAAEKSKLNEMLWDDETSIPLEHQTIVKNRIAKAKKNPKDMLDWDKVSKTL